MGLLLPGGIKVFVNGVDITFYIFGYDEYDPTPINYAFRDIDISGYIDNAGIHEILVTTTKEVFYEDDGSPGVDAGNANGRLDCRVEIV